MSKKFDVLGIGSVLVDELVLLPGFPTPDTKIEIINTQKQLGGPVPTALRALAKLKLSTSFIGKIGNDYNASFIKEKLVDSNVDITNIIEEIPSQSGFSQVWIDLNKGTRTIAFSSGTLTPFNYLDFNFKNLPKTKILHVDGRDHFAVKDVIRHYKSQGTLISIDTGNFRAKTLELLELTDIVIMPKRFASEMIGDFNPEEMLFKLRRKYPDTLAIIITDGENGSVCSYKERIYKQSAFEVSTFDTTGAGDLHSAGIIYGFINKLPIEKTLEFAAALAGIKCMHLGNGTLPDLNQINAFITEQSVIRKPESRLIRR